MQRHPTRCQVEPQLFCSVHATTCNTETVSAVMFPMMLLALLCAGTMAADSIPTTFGQAMHHHHLGANITGEVSLLQKVFVAL